MDNLKKLFVGSSHNQGLSSLALRSLEKLNTSQLERIKNDGIWRDRKSYFLNISYPSMQAMPSVEQKIVMPPQITKTGKQLAVYIHIPFCTAECYYCHYYKKFGQSSAVVDVYINGVLQELSMYERHFGGLLAKSIYIGGGTPSYMTAPQIDRLFTGIKKYITVASGAEVSFEIHPESGSLDKLEILYRHGVNRINIGVESFDDKTLKSENRRHNAADVRELFEIATTVGFENINLDLIYGLRGQDVHCWENNLDHVSRIRPSSSTMYYLRLKRGTPEYKLWKSYPETFPTDFELLLMHAMNFERMEVELGYIQNPVDWFIRDKRYFHEYQDYNWRRSDEIELLGIGASAYSYINGWQFYNVNDVERYNQSISKGGFPIWKGEFLDGEEKMRRTLMLGIKMGIDRRDFLSTYGYDVLSLFPSTWERLVGLGLVEVNSEVIELTYTGKLFADEVGQQFYSDTMKRRMACVDPELVSTTWPQFNP